MTKAAEFFESLLEKRDDGFYHAKSGGVYEGGYLVEDAVTELSMAKALFRGVLKAAEVLQIDLGEKTQKWRKIVENLYPFITVTAPEQVIGETDRVFKLKVGVFNGNEVPSRELIAAGRRLTDGKIMASRIYSAKSRTSGIDFNKKIPLVVMSLESRSRYSLFMHGGEVFPVAELCPVFPAEICGLGDKNTALFKACVSTVKAYSPEFMGIEPLPIFLARLGLAEEAMLLLEERPDKWQIYCNGFWRGNGEDESKADSIFFFGVNRVRDADTPEKKFDCASWPYRHMEFEPMSVLSCAINEMLIQSHEGIIRIAPAFKWNAEFSLHAVGGFVVSSEIKNGSAQWVAIKSLLGNHCKIENPWGMEQVYICENDSIIKSDGSGIISFDTVEGNMYILSTDKDIKKTWKVRQKMFKRNVAPKTSKSGIASLGLPRMF